MRRTPRLASFCALLWIAGCGTVSPGQALTSTIPLSAETERLKYIGDVSGKACKSTLLFIIPIESDASIYEAKRDALRYAQRRYQRQAVALIDVSIDFELTSYLVFERHCTLLRGKALAAEPRKALSARSASAPVAGSPAPPEPQLAPPPTPEPTQESGLSDP